MQLIIAFRLHLIPSMYLCSIWCYLSLVRNTKEWLSNYIPHDLTFLWGRFWMLRQGDVSLCRSREKNLQPIVWRSFEGIKDVTSWRCYTQLHKICLITYEYTCLPPSIVYHNEKPFIFTWKSCQKCDTLGSCTVIFFMEDTLDTCT